MKKYKMSISDKIHNITKSANKIFKNYYLFLALKLKNTKKLFCGDICLSRYYFLGVFLIFVEQANANPNENMQSTQNVSQDSKQSDMTQIKLDKVTATANEYDIQSEAKNIIVIDKDDIANKGYTNLEQALEHQPAITFTPGPNGQKQIDIRGREWTH
ncbi:TonB-dependent receptor plug domain-containing protein [Helicobacter sp. 23-1046]